MKRKPWRPVGRNRRFGESVRPVAMDGGAFAVFVGSWMGAAMMGVVAQFESCPADAWPRILDRLTAVGVVIDEFGEERGLLWCGCRRGRTSIGLALDPRQSTENVTLYCGSLRYWKGFPMTPHLFGLVIAAVRITASETARPPKDTASRSDAES